MGEPSRSGPLLFARYAHPPNMLGYCGPPDAGGLLAQLARTDGKGDLETRARRFEGAWPYLQSIAGANGIIDPLDEKVVEAYWVGNPLLEKFTATETFPHHSFHVLAVYPWLGILRSGRLQEPLRVLDQCRIRWGRVEEVRGGDAVVRSRPLVWDDGRLGYGVPRAETVTWAIGGEGVVERLQVGEWVSMHWNWICDHLDEPQRDALERFSALSLAAVNQARDQ